MDIDTDISNKPNTQSSEQYSTTSEAINLTQPSQNQQSQSSYASTLQSNNNTSTSNQPKVHPKLNPTFDWIANFPISEEMQSNNKLQTSFSFQLF